MSSTYSPILRTELITNGEQAGTWGTTTNDNFSYIFEQAIAGYQTVAISPSSNNQVLTYVYGAVAAGTPANNQSLYAALKLTAGSVTANFSLFIPPVSKPYIFWNTSGYTATIYNSTSIGNTTAAGAGLVIPNNARVNLFTDGTNCYDSVNQITSNLGIGGNLTVSGNLSGTTGSFSGAVIGSSTASFTGTVVSSSSITGTTITSSTQFTGPGTGLTGTASGLSIGGNAATATLASTVTTNANLTGVITSVGNATSIASQTGTGTKFVVDTSPTIATPALTNPTITNYVETVYTATGSLTVSLANGTVQKITTSGTTNITLPASVTGKSVTIIVVYGGSDAINFLGGTTIKWANGTTPTGTSVVGKIDIFNFYQDGLYTYGAIYGQNF